MSGSVLELKASPQMDPKQIYNDLDGVKMCVLILLVLLKLCCLNTDYSFCSGEPWAGQSTFFRSERPQQQPECIKVI